MPQPIKNYTDLRFSPFAISTHKNPVFAGQFSTIVGQWANAEYDMSQLALRILGLHAEAALPLYETLQSGKTQRDAIESLVRANLPKSLLPEFESIWRGLSVARKQRNHVVHGIWALSKDFPDDLILLDQSEMLSRDATLFAFEESNDPTKLVAIGPQMRKLSRYTSRDFRDIILRIHGARFALSEFSLQHFSSPPKS